MSGTDKKKKHKSRRKSVLVKSGLQFRYILTLIIVASASFAFSIHEIIWAMRHIAEKNPAVKEIINGILSEFQALMPALGIKIIVFLVILVIFGFLASNQLAGPLYRFEKSLQYLTRGDFTFRAYLRKGDSLTDAQQKFNEMASFVHKTVSDYENFRSYAAGSSDPMVRKRATDLGENIKQNIPEFKI